jgi:hypothetical protein
MFLSLFLSFCLPYFQRPSASELLRHPFVQTASKTDRWQDFVRQKVQLMRQLQRELVGATGTGPEAGQITLVSYPYTYIHAYKTFVFKLAKISFF